MTTTTFTGSLFNKVVRLNRTQLDKINNDGSGITTDKNTNDDSNNGNGYFQYYYVLTYIPDLQWCHLAPLRQVGIFGSDKPKAEGRPIWMLVDENEGKELDISATLCIPVKARSLKRTIDADQEQWDILDGDSLPSTSLLKDLSKSLLYGTPSPVSTSKNTATTTNRNKKKQQQQEKRRQSSSSSSSSKSSSYTSFLLTNENKKVRIRLNGRIITHKLPQGTKGRPRGRPRKSDISINPFAAGNKNSSLTSSIYSSSNRKKAPPPPPPPSLPKLERTATKNVFNLKVSPHKLPPASSTAKANYNMSAAASARAEELIRQEVENTDPYDVGTIVMVQARTWIGINKPGGVGRVTKVATNGTEIFYDVAYVLGGKEKRIDAVYVTSHEIDNDDNDNGDDAKSLDGMEHKIKRLPKRHSPIKKYGFTTEAEDDSRAHHHYRAASSTPTAVSLDQIYDEGNTKLVRTKKVGKQEKDDGKANERKNNKKSPVGRRFPDDRPENYASIYRNRNAFQLKINPNQRYVGAFPSRKQAEFAGQVAEEYMNVRKSSFEEAKKAALATKDDAAKNDETNIDDNVGEEAGENTADDNNNVDSSSLAAAKEASLPLKVAAGRTIIDSSSSSLTPPQSPSSNLRSSTRKRSATVLSSPFDIYSRVKKRSRKSSSEVLASSSARTPSIGEAIEYTNDNGVTSDQAIAQSDTKKKAVKSKGVKVNKKRKKLKSPPRRTFGGEGHIYGSIYPNRNKWQVKINPGQQYVGVFDSKAKAEAAMQIAVEHMNIRGSSFEVAKVAALVLKAEDKGGATDSADVSKSPTNNEQKSGDSNTVARGSTVNDSSGTDSTGPPNTAAEGEKELSSSSRARLTPTGKKRNERLVQLLGPILTTSPLSSPNRNRSSVLKNGIVKSQENDRSDGNDNPTGSSSSRSPRRSGRAALKEVMPISTTRGVMA